MNLRQTAWLAATLVAFASAPVHAQDKPLMPLRIGTLKIAAQTDVFVAQKHGIYTKNGIDPKISFFNTGAESIPALQGGSIDVLLSIPGIGMTAMERGLDLVPIFQDEIAQAKPPSSSSVQVLDSSPIKTLADLRGKKIGVGSLSTQNTIGVKMLLDQAGVDPANVSFSEIPFPAMANALKAGHVDAVVPVDPFTTNLRLNGGRVLVYNYSASIPEQPLGVWFTKGSIVKANPKAIEAFNASMKEAIDFLNADETRARDEIADYIKIDRTMLNSMPLIGWDYRVKPDRWQAVIDMMVKYAGLKPRKAEDFMTPQLQPYIVK